LSSSAVNPRVCQADGTWTGDDVGVTCTPVGEYDDACVYRMSYFNVLFKRMQIDSLQYI